MTTWTVTLTGTLTVNDESALVAFVADVVSERGDISEVESFYDGWEQADGLAFVSDDGPVYDPESPEDMLTLAIAALPDLCRGIDIQEWDAEVRQDEACPPVAWRFEVHAGDVEVDDTDPLGPLSDGATADAPELIGLAFLAAITGIAGTTPSSVAVDVVQSA